MQDVMIARPVIVDTNKQGPLETPIRSNDLDNEYLGGKASLEYKLLTAAGRNFVATVKDLAQVCTGVANVPAGVVFAVKDLLDAGKYTAARAMLGDAFDKQAQAIKDPHSQGIAKELAAKAKANLKAIPDGDLARMFTGAGWAVRGAGAALIDAGQMAVQAPAAIAIGGVKGVGYVAGKGVGFFGVLAGAIMYGIGRAVEWVGEKVKNGGAHVAVGSADLFDAADAIRPFKA